jgi:hypothetical protein
MFRDVSLVGGSFAKKSLSRMRQRLNQQGDSHAGIADRG